MKRVILFFVSTILLCSNSYSQAPDVFQYQAVVRDNAGVLIADQDVNFQIDIIQSSIAGENVYSESHSARTNSLGLVTLEIGNGTSSDDFSSIKWASDSHYIKVWMNGTEMGTIQLMSVPYALYAKKARTFDVLLEKGDTPCSESTKGAMRYNEETNMVEFCNGSNWIALSGGLSVSLAQLSTKPAYNISTEYGLSGGIISSNGGAEIFEKGVCYNTTGTPTITDSKTNDGSGSEEFESYISAISNEKYYIRAYAKNTAGIAYGDEQSFTTLVVLTGTDKGIYLSNTSFQTGGIVEEGGNEAISERGIVFGLNPEPTKTDNYVASGSGSGEFESTITGIEDQTYFYRSFAINASGINYGPESSYRNHVVTESSIGIAPSAVDFSSIYGDSGSPPGADSEENGKQNTELLVQRYGAAATAAHLCDTLTVKGHDDWFLPSKEELRHIYLNRNDIGIVALDVYYWSSTVNNYESSWVQNFQTGIQTVRDRTLDGMVVCIRRKE